MRIRFETEVCSHLVMLNDPGLTTSASNDVLGSNAARCDEAVPALLQDLLGAAHVEQPCGTALIVLLDQ